MATSPNPRLNKAAMTTTTIPMSLDERQLLQAIQAGDIERLERLCGETAKHDAVNDDGKRALLLTAIATNQHQVLQVLIDHSWPIHDATNDDGDDEDEGIVRSDSCVGSAALNLAVEVASVDCIRILLAHGATVEAASTADGMRLTPLHVAAMYNTTASDIHHTLIQSTIDVNVRDLCCNTPLHLAAAYGSTHVAEALLAAGGDANAVNASGATPLSLAASNGFVDIVDVLIAHGADVNAKDALGNTPLIDASFVTQSPHFACGDAASQHRVITRLLQLDVDINVVNRDGNSAIAGAIRNGYLESARELLARGASVNHQNRRGETVLHIAARAGVDSIELWRRLLLAGADVTARDRYDRTCYEVWVSRPKQVATPERDQDTDSSDPIARMLKAALERTVQ